MDIFKKKCLINFIILPIVLTLLCSCTTRYKQPIHDIIPPDSIKKIDLTIDLLLTNEYLKTEYNEKLLGGGTHIFPIGENLETHTINLMEKLFTNPIVRKENTMVEESLKNQYVMKPKIIYVNMVQGSTGWAEGKLSLGMELNLTRKDGELIWIETIEGEGTGTLARFFSFPRYYQHLLKESLQDLFNKSYAAISSSKMIRSLKDLPKIEIKALAKKTPTVNTPASKAPVNIARIKLRSTPKKLKKKQVKAMLKQYNFYDHKHNKTGDFKNAFIDNQDGTITDESTGLIWEKVGSPSKLDPQRANQYIEKLNWKTFGGRTDWRLPTVEELASLIESQPSQRDWLYINPVFGDPQGACADRCWSADKKDPVFGNPYGGWVVSFWHGTIKGASWSRNIESGQAHHINEENFVKAVCLKRSANKK